MYNIYFIIFFLRNVSFKLKITKYQKYLFHIFIIHNTIMITLFDILS